MTFPVADVLAPKLGTDPDNWLKMFGGTGIELGTEPQAVLPLPEIADCKGILL